MQRITCLLDHHTRLIQVSEELLDQARATSPDPACASDTLAELQALLREHLEVEGQLIAELAKEGPGLSDPLLLNRRDYFKSLVADWTCYIDKWDAEAVHRDWASFASATIRIVRRLIEQIVAENHAVLAISRRLSEPTVGDGSQRDWRSSAC